MSTKLTKKDVFEQGKSTGYDIAKENISMLDTMKEDDFVSEMASFESDTFRQYSPFEFFAHDINSSGSRAEMLWDSYDNGVLSGIKKAVREYNKENKNA